MSEARAVVVLALFVGGIVGGVVLQRVTDSAIRTSPYPTLERIAEPQPGARVATALAANDPRALARLMGNETLTALKDALTDPLGAPIADIRKVKFVGATERDGHVLAGYLVTGKDIQGTDAIVGFVLDVENGEIVGVNN